VTRALPALAAAGAIFMTSAAWAPGSSAAPNGGSGPGETPASIEAALGFLAARTSAFGLVDSFVEDEAALAYTYDNAMAALARVSAGELGAAAAIFDAYAVIGAEDGGGFLHRYGAEDGGAAGGLPGVGHNAYLLLALALYHLESGDGRFDAMALGLADHLLDHQDLDGGLFGRAGVTWKSTENNLAAYRALNTLGRLFARADLLDAADRIRAFLERECWDGTRFLTGENDPSIVTDAQALGALVLGPGFAGGAFWVEGHTLATRRYYRGRRVTGFDLDTDRDAVWTEGTLQQALAFAEAGDAARAAGYRQEAEKLVLSSGGFWQASNPGSTGFGDTFQRWQAAAPTAWYVLAAGQDNVFAPLP